MISHSVTHLSVASSEENTVVSAGQYKGREGSDGTPTLAHSMDRQALAAILWAGLRRARPQQFFCSSTPYGEHSARSQYNHSLILMGEKDCCGAQLSPSPAKGKMRWGGEGK